MNNALHPFIPASARTLIDELLEHDQISIRIKNKRQTKHGDYKALTDGRHQITINSNLNSFRFLITLLHEIAHFETYQNYGPFIKPHGKEWKLTFKRLMLPFLRPEVFPNELLPLLARHFKNPKASSDTDTELAFALKQFDPPNELQLIHEIPFGRAFKLYNGRIFTRGNKRVKRYECIEIKTGKLYLFNPNAEVQLIED